MIPKIIHQFAPKDTSRWHVVWFPCHESWKDNYKTFEHILWTEELLDSFVKDKFSQYYDLYKSSCHICQIDISKYMVLYYYGGICADMDTYCYENFYDKMNGDTCLVQSIPPVVLFGDGICASFFIAAKSKNLFMKHLIEKSFGNLKNNIHELGPIKMYGMTMAKELLIKKVAGPTFISDEYEKFSDKKSIQILNWQEYNPELMFFSENIKMKHMLTGIWGKQKIDCVLEQADSLKISNIERFKDEYLNFRHIDLNNFDFRKNYT